MRRKPQGFFRVVTSVRVYLDDLRRLHDEMARVSGKVRVDTDQFELDGIDDVADIPGDRLFGLSLRATNPSVTVEFARLGAFVFRHDDDPSAVGLAELIRQQLLAFRRPAHWVFTWWALGCVLLVDVLASIVNFLDLAGDASRAVGIGVSLVVLVGGGVLLFGRLRRGSVVYLRNRRDAPSFFKRNADQLIVSGISTALGAAIGSLLTWNLTRE
jgi:hypothetical protein